MEELKLPTINTSFNSGQALVEVLVALGSAVIIMVALTSSVISGLSNAQQGRNQVLATQYAQEGIEYIRKMRDSDFATFNGYISASKTYCFDKARTLPLTEVAGEPFVSEPKCPENVDNFIRELVIEPAPGDPYPSDCQPNNPGELTPTPIPSGAIKITSTVLWRDGKCGGSEYCHSSTQVVCLSDYSLVPTP